MRQDDQANSARRFSYAFLESQAPLPYERKTYLSIRTVDATTRSNRDRAMKLWWFKLRTCVWCWHYGMREWSWNHISHDEWAQYYEYFDGDAEEAALEGWFRD